MAQKNDVEVRVRRHTLIKSATKGDLQDQKGDYSIQQPEFESAASSTKGKDPHVEHAATPSDLPPEQHAEGGKTSKLRAASESPSPGSEEAQQPSSSPLPDLRQGIPSTFDKDFSDRSSSFQSKESETSELNLTEDPATGGGRGRDNPGLDREYLTSIEKRRLRFARYLYTLAAMLGISGTILLGWNWDNEEEARKHPEAPNGLSASAVYGRIKARMAEALGYWLDPAFPDLLPDQHPDFVPPGTPTLVLSLEDLLVHSKWSRQKGWEVAKRPGVDYFLRYLSQYYELVIFTTVSRMNAELVIAKLDPYRVVQWPLFREATRFVNGQPVKDLSALNRPLAKTIIVDTAADHVQLQPDNAVILPKWTGEASDPHTKDLVALIPFLEYLANMSIDDYRKVIKSYEGAEIPTEFARREARTREAFNKSMTGSKGGRGRSGGGLSSALGFKPGGGLMQIPGEPSLAEGFAQGKMLSDQIRERGQKNYEEIDKSIREGGEEMLKTIEEENKKAQEEAMKSMQSGIGNFFRWGGSKEDGDKKKDE
ncbi:MAG: mitochondrial inner membrane protein required for protein import [Chrysothrix sp. TS-e1954]|nr:MAG: mitochondrial inner membrane protein required for protein import [Chrysothrix sp. TS-e1954]